MTGDEYWAMFQTDVSWYRTSTKWTARNAWLKWGCLLCYDCDGIFLEWFYDSGTFTPGWFNNSQSYVYIYSSNFPELQGWATDDWPRASSYSDGYYNGVKKGNMWPVATFKPAELSK
jgi:hypothetical protein